ncbi:MAG: hypothetical protein WBF93_07545, partial [Pirellulales bacterium]
GYACPPLSLIQGDWARDWIRPTGDGRCGALGIPCDRNRRQFPPLRCCWGRFRGLGIDLGGNRRHVHRIVSKRFELIQICWLLLDACPPTTNWQGISQTRQDIRVVWIRGENTQLCRANRLMQQLRNRLGGKIICRDPAACTRHEVRFGVIVGDDQTM